MGIFAELRTSLENPQTPLSYPAEWLLDIFNGGRTDSGLRVSEMTALQVTTVFACVNLVSSAMGFLPFHVYERVTARDRRPAKRLAHDHDLYDLLRYRPNREMTSFTFRKTLQAHALLWGNLYAEIERDRGNRIVAVWPRNPARTRPARLTQDAIVKGERVRKGELVYRTTEGMEELSAPDAELTPDAPDRTIVLEDMVHVPGLSLDGRLGQSVIQLARQAMGLSLATEKFGSKVFGNGARPSGIITHPGKLTPEAREQAKRSWQEAQGGENQGRIALLESGITFTPVSMTPDESQFLETRKFQVAEVCRVFGVPPHMVADTEKTNRANTEQIGLEFVTFALNPWLEAWQQEFTTKMLWQSPEALRRDSGRPRRNYFVKFETRQLTMPDADSLGKFLTILKQWGYGSTNDGREWLDWNPIDEPWADKAWMPINMQEAGAPPPEPASAAAAKEEKNGEIAKRFAKAYFPLFCDAMGRISTRSGADSGDFRRVFLPVLSTVSEQLCEMASADFGCDPAPVSNSNFLHEYIEGMRARSGDWPTREQNLLTQVELCRAIRALLIEVYRAVATSRAKELAA